jgi:cytidylate kinase
MPEISDKLPVLIYISGAPGSGKTTLARKISEELYIPHISSDLVHGGISFTLNEKNDRTKSIHEVYVPLLVSMSKMNISYVVDHVLQRNLSEKDILDKLMPFARIIYIHLQSINSIDRHIERELNRSDRGVQLTNEELVIRAKYHQDNLAKTQEPLDVTLPTLVINTSDGYEPTFDSIIQFIEENRNST